jgi:hypothetical protein
MSLTAFCKTGQEEAKYGTDSSEGSIQLEEDIEISSGESNNSHLSSGFLVSTTSHSTNPTATTVSATKKITFGGVEIDIATTKQTIQTAEVLVMHKKEDQKKLPEDKCSALFENMVKQVLAYKLIVMSYKFESEDVFDDTLSNQMARTHLQNHFIKFYMTDVCCCAQILYFCQLSHEWMSQPSCDVI